MGSGERTLACQYKLVQRTKLPRNSNREHFNLERWHPHIGFYHFWGRLVCILGTVRVRHTANLPPPTSRALTKLFCPSDLQAIYEIWITPCWGRTRSEVLCCVWDKRGGRVGERQMIAYEMAKEWETITVKISSRCMCSTRKIAQISKRYLFVLLYGD